MISRQRPKEEHPELFLPLVTHADVRKRVAKGSVGMAYVKR